jgi:hypothetical protein
MYTSIVGVCIVVILLRCSSKSVIYFQSPMNVVRYHLDRPNTLSKNVNYEVM